jgi:uncharacterized membrane protein
MFPIYTGVIMKGIIWINLLLGIWLIIAPFAFAVTGAPMGNDIVLGILLVAFSWWVLGAMAPPVGTAWFEILCGIWLIVAPFALGYGATHALMANDVIVGIVTIIVAAVTAREIAHTPTAAA